MLPPGITRTCSSACLLVGIALNYQGPRNVISPIQGQTWWKDHGNGFGAAIVKPVNGPGVCGAPYQHDGDWNRYVGAGPNQATYTAGGVINVGWWIQVNHGGRIGVKLCNRRDNIDQGCFNQFQLQRADGLGPFVYLLSGASQGQLSGSAEFRLPAGVSCSGGCVLQWEYLTMNSCFEACPNRAACGPYADRRNPITGASNMATCCFGSGCSSANIPEVFRNCADITITGSSGGTPPGGTPPPTGCQRTAPGGGTCGGGTCCPSGQCCSQWGYCGTTSGLTV
ncbi:hypothetical protein OEZ86_010284 [Tetradesmus obliquus]|nr:hypothetical protein OEZ86_010284 [Tetradesmus obliquus]